MRIMCGSPVRQSPEILKCFLDSLARQTVQMDCVFVDDNTDATSSVLLTESNGLVVSAGMWTPALDDYTRDDVTHHWTNSAIWRVAKLKDYLIRVRARKGLRLPLPRRLRSHSPPQDRREASRSQKRRHLEHLLDCVATKHACIAERVAQQRVRHVCGS